MRYALLIYCHEDTLVSDRERQRREEQRTAVLDGLRARSLLADTQRLRPARAARTVRCWAGGDITITDGPAAQPRGTAHRLGHRRVRRPGQRRSAGHHDPGRLVPLDRGPASRRDADLTQLAV